MLGIRSGVSGVRLAVRVEGRAGVHEESDDETVETWKCQNTK